jgi:hypothetical protein
MCTSDEEDVQQLLSSLRALHNSFLKRFPYPVAIFHEDYTPELMRRVQDAAGEAGFVYFVKIAFQLPKFLKPLLAEPVTEVKHRIPNPQHPTGWHTHQHGLRPYNKRAQAHPFGYQHMCRFFSGAGFSLPFFDHFDWYWRLDSDTTCGGEAQFDVFDHLSSCGREYAHLAPMFGDGGDVVEGLWNAAVNFTQIEGIKPKWLYNHHLFSQWGADDLFNVIPSFMTNCEVASLAFLRSKQVQKLHRHLDRNGGYFLHRWGDAPVRFLQVATTIHQQQTENLHGITCQHI